MQLYEAALGNTITYILAGAMVGYLMYSFIKARKRLSRPASEHIRILDDSNFKQTIKSGVSLVDFWASWCGPCKVQGPIVDEVADEIGDRANICKVDVDVNQKIAQEMGIRNIPTILLFKDGVPVERLVGVKTRAALIKAVEAQLQH